jgi:CBS domain-containing protein
VKDVLVKDIMSYPLISVSETSSVQSVAKLMMMKGVGSVLVSNGEKYFGIITKKDIVFLVANGGDPKKVVAKEIMNSPLRMVDVSCTVFDAAKEIIKSGVRRIIVSKDGKPVGMISDRDIIKVAPEIIELAVENARIK